MNHEIDRLPSKKERIIGIISSSFLMVIFGAISILTILMEEYIASVFFILLTLFIARIAYRVVFTKPEKPNNNCLYIAHIVFIIAGGGLVVGSFFVSDSNRFMGLAIGLIGLSTGVHYFFKRTQKN